MSGRSSPDPVRATFDAWARDGRGDALEDEHRDVVLQMLDRAALLPHHHVLDLGCGTGWTVVLLARLVPQGRAFGVDASPEMIAAARSRPHPPNAAFTAAPVSALPYAPDSIHRIVSMESIYYWPDLDAGLREAFRVLRPGGRFLAALEYYRENPHSAHWAQAMNLPLLRLSAPEYEEHLRAAGFEEVRSERLRDRRRILPPEEFRPDCCFPDHDTFRRHREAGALLLIARKPGVE